VRAVRKGGQRSVADQAERTFDAIGSILKSNVNSKLKKFILSIQ
jgi:hypothetical protein